MYYEERTMDGETVCRYSPNGDWQAVSNRAMTQEIARLRAIIKELEK